MGTGREPSVGEFSETAQNTDHLTGNRYRAISYVRPTAPLVRDMNNYTIDTTVLHIRICCTTIALICPNFVAQQCVPFHVRVWAVLHRISSSVHQEHSQHHGHELEHPLCRVHQTVYVPYGELSPAPRAEQLTSCSDQYIQVLAMLGRIGQPCSQVGMLPVLPTTPPGKSGHMCMQGTPGHVVDGVHTAAAVFVHQQRRSRRWEKGLGFARVTLIACGCSSKR